MVGGVADYAFNKRMIHPSRGCLHQVDHGRDPTSTLCSAGPLKPASQISCESDVIGLSGSLRPLPQHLSVQFFRPSFYARLL